MGLTDYLYTLKEPWIWKMVIFFLLPWVIGCFTIIFIMVAFFFHWLWGDYK